MIAAALWVALLLADAPLPAPAPADAPAAPSAPPGATSPISVTLTEPPAGDAVLAEASTRIRAELAASGIASTQVDCTPGGAAEGAGCPPLAETRATISLAREGDVAAIDVSMELPDGLELRRHVRVLARDGGDDPSVLAVRAVELLRDLRPSARPPARRRAATGGPALDGEEPAPLSPPPPEEAPPKPRPWRLSIGPAMLATPRKPGVGPTIGAALSGGLLLGSHVAVFATAAGPFNTNAGPVSDTSSGVKERTATLVQAIATIELRYRATFGPVQPFGAILTGVNYLHETASGGTLPAPSPPPGTSVDAKVVPAFGAGGGVSFEVLKGFTASLEAVAFVTSPEVLVEVNHVITNRVGFPSIMAQANVGLVLP
ncbi:MAG TPA: hypothetical protein VKZ18_08750 [Polyangia bacterium]|nr:hypothetical protein [Polyangia bacterium]